MKIVLDTVVRDGHRYVVYVSLQDEMAGNKVIATASFKYDEGDGTEAAKEIAIEAFKKKIARELARQVKLEQVKSDLSTALAEIDVSKI